MNNSRTTGTCSSTGAARRGFLIVVHTDFLYLKREKDIEKWSSTFIDIVQFHEMSEGSPAF
jgi:hypothetical protein